MRSLAVSRREKAERELGQTTIKRYVAWGVLWLFLVTVLSTPIVQIITEIRGDYGNYSVFSLFPSREEFAAVALWFRQIPTLPTKALVRGVRSLLGLLPSLKEINDCEDALEEESVVSNWIMPHVQYPLTRGLHAGNEQVYPGKDGWLFYRADMDYLTSQGFLDPAHLEAQRFGGKSWEQPPQPDPRQAIREFGRQLKKRDIELIVVPTPVKASIHPRMFSSRFNLPSQPLQNPSYRAFIKDLEEAGILVFDVSQTLLDESRRTGKAQYLKTDTHWTPAAMELAARNLAELIRSKVDLSQSGKVTYEQKPVEITNLGDITRMLKLPADQTMFPREQVVVHPVRNPSGEYLLCDAIAKAQRASEHCAEILLLGDSFSNIYSLEDMGWGSSAGLVEHLNAQLGQPVDRIVINAGGAYTTRQALYQELARGDDRLAGKRVVVYQFAARELFSGDWRLYQLPKLKTREPAVAKEEKFTVIRATIRDNTDPPGPGSVPYRDCLIALHLADIQTDGEAFPVEEIVVFLWGMRYDKWTEAASLRTGQRVKLRVQPWEQVENEYGSYNRKELDSEDSWFLDVYWGEIVP